MIRLWHRPAIRAAFPWMLLSVLVALHASFERSMAAHMLAHIPLIAVAGALIGHQARAAARRPLGRPMQTTIRFLSAFNQHGVTGLLYATLTGMFWMIPKALDDVLLSPSVAIAKYVSVGLAGILVAVSWQRAHAVIRLFFVGGFCWTSAIAGMLYQESTARLCNFYLLDDQVWAGRGLVILAIVLPSIWAIHEVRLHAARTQQARVNAGLASH